MQDNLKETSVVVQMDNSRALNMDKIVSDVRAQYEDIAARSREEAENWHKTKVSNQWCHFDERTNKSHCFRVAKLVVSKVTGRRKVHSFIQVHPFC